MPPRAPVTVAELLTGLDQRGYRVVAGSAGLNKPITHRAVQRLGVALTGYTTHLETSRLQMLGNSESGYLQSLQPSQRAQVLEKVLSAGFPGLVMTAAHMPSPEMVGAANAWHVAVICTDQNSTDATEQINRELGQRLAPHEHRHGVLVDIYGIGVLLLGKSGIGKSELALELVAGGHRLVADDQVELWQSSPKVVTGMCPTSLGRHHLEIRGLGILNAKDLFGAAAVREQKRVELVAELVEWDPQGDYERVGDRDTYIELAGVQVQLVVLPVRSGRSLRLVIEVAARNALLRAQGTHSARNFVDRQHAALSNLRIDAAEGEAEE
jgi:HPr kinase/phosphorylase